MQQSSGTQPSLRTFDYTVETQTQTALQGNSSGLQELFNCTAAYSYADHVTLGCWLEVLDVDEEVLRVAAQLALLDVVPYQLLHGLLDTFGLVGLIVERAALGHQKVAQAIVASKMAPAQRYIHQQYWKTQREVQKQAQQDKQRMARSLEAPSWAASRTRGRHGGAQTPFRQLMQEALQSPRACRKSISKDCMHQPHSNAMPVTAESTAPLRPSRSAGASLDTAHSCQVEESALGSAVELSRSSACLSLRTAARTQRRLFFDSANLDNDDGVALNKVSRGSLEYMRASKGSLEYRLVSSRSLNSRQISKGGTAVVSPAVVPTAALLGAALAGQQSMQQPLPAVLHRTMAPIAAVLIAMLLAIVAVCAAHYLRA